MLPVAVLAWWGGHLLQVRQTAPGRAPAFAVPGSAYGSLAARLIRDSLYSYWHGGEGSQALPVKQSPSAPPPPPAPGRFARRGQLPPPVKTAAPEESAEDVGGLDGWVNKLARLEKARTRRNSSFPLSPAHQRYVDASATTRLKLAYALDPGDAVLYEVLYFHLASRPGPLTAPALQALTAQAMQYGLRPLGSLSDALTAAGAAINVLNEQLQGNRPGSAEAPEVLAAREVLKQGLARYDALHQEAEQDGWWEGIPAIRRAELENHAAQLRRIAELIDKTLSPAKPAGSQ